MVETGGGTELEAFAAECESVEATLRGAAGADPAGPGLGDWTLGELVGHLVGVAGRLDRLAGKAIGGGEREVDRYRYFATTPRWSFDDPAPAPAGWQEAFRTAWTSSVRAFERLEPDALLPSPCGTIAPVEYLATRVLEVVVHHMDVCAALDRPRSTTPEAGRLTLALLEGLLDGPRPRNLGRTRFILAATGRIPLDDPRFPVLT